MKFSEKEQKNAIYGVLAIGAAAIIYKSTIGDDSGGVSDPTGNGIGSNPGSQSGYPVIKFDPVKVADKLYEAMRYNGTDELTVQATLKNVSQAQFGDVMYRWGKRSYNPLTGNQYTIPGIKLTLYPLDFWLKSEFSDKDYNIFRMKYPNHL